jgi:GNAT superfamily N-acetyltransferase
MTSEVGGDVRVREARAEDADTLHALICALADHHGQRAFVRSTPADLRRDIAGPEPRFGALLAEVDGRVAGFASWIWFHSIWLGGRVMNIDDVFVHSDCRGRGVGEALMHAARAVCRAHGAPRLRWEVQPDNVAAIRFYERLGARMRTKGLFAWDAAG